MKPLPELYWSEAPQSRIIHCNAENVAGAIYFDADTNQWAWSVGYKITKTFGAQRIAIWLPSGLVVAANEEDARAQIAKWLEKNFDE